MRPQSRPSIRIGPPDGDRRHETVSGWSLSDCAELRHRERMRSDPAARPLRIVRSAGWIRLRLAMTIRGDHPETVSRPCLPPRSARLGSTARLCRVDAAHPEIPLPSDLPDLRCFCRNTAICLVFGRVAVSSLMKPVTRLSIRRPRFSRDLRNEVS